MSTPDVRWDDCPHGRIAEWANNARGAAVTEILEARLKSVAEVLKTVADTVNGALQRVSGGEWTGHAATLATQAMRVLRDFDDAMGHHGEMNSLAAYGQSDNASWVKVSVPAVVDVRAPQIPTGGPIDILNSTVDYHHQLQAAKDAEEQARQVMRQYEAMTVGRIAALPPLSLPSPVAVAVSEVASLVDPGPDRGPRDEPPGGKPDDSTKTEAPQPGGPAVGGQQVLPGASGSSVGGSTGGGVAGSTAPATDPAGASGGQPPFGSAVPGGSTGDAGRTGPAPVGFGAVVGKPGVDAVPPRGGHGAAAPPEPGARGGQPGTGARGGEVWGRNVRQGGAAGMTPVGTAAPGRSEEDKEHQVKYRVPGSEIFEPDHEDGLLFDPFRPGSFVAPATIGDDDDE